jgi:AraC-like DNA-binding protein
MPSATKPAELKWISARHLQHFITHAEAASVDVDKLLEDAGLNRARLADPDYAVPVSAIELMLATITREHNQPLAGLRLSRNIQPATFGPLGFIAQVCPTIGDVLDTLVRYNGLLSNIGNTSIVHAPGSVEVRWECSAGGRVFRQQATEYVLGAAVTLIRLLIPGRSDLPQCVNFAHPRPASPRYAREYVSYFRCPVYFERPESSIVLPAVALKTKLRHGDAFVRELMERHAANMLKQRGSHSSIPDEVSHLIRAMIVDGVPGKDAIAAQLGMSGRNLHRKLREAGTSYHAQLDQVRLEIAREHLALPDESSGEISDHLGFSTRQAFLRWFKQSTGKTPTEYRNQIRQDDNP